MRVHPFVAGDEILYRDEIGNLLIYNVSSAASRILLDSSNTVSSRTCARARKKSRGRFRGNGAIGGLKAESCKRVLINDEGRSGIKGMI